VSGAHICTIIHQRTHAYTHTCVPTASQNRCGFGAKRRGCTTCWWHTYTQPYTNAHTYTHTQPYTNAHTYTHTQSYTNAHTYTHTHVYTHTCEPTASQIGYGIGAKCRSRATRGCPLGNLRQTSCHSPGLCKGWNSIVE